MKKIFLAFLLVFVIGCNSEAKRTSQENVYCSRKFASLMQSGKTTREQEQQYILIIQDMFYQQDRYIRGTKKADITKKNAEIEAKTGLDLSKPLNLE